MDKIFLDCGLGGILVDTFSFLAFDLDINYALEDLENQFYDWSKDTKDR